MSEEIDNRKFRVIDVKKYNDTSIWLNIYKDEWGIKEFTKYFLFYADRLEKFLISTNMISKDVRIELFDVFDHTEYVVLRLNIFNIEPMGDF